MLKAMPAMFMEAYRQALDLERITAELKEQFAIDSQTTVESLDIEAGRRTRSHQQF
jgi:hypothetical protein